MSSFQQALSSVDWRALRHAHGTADDLPELFTRMEKASVSEVKCLYGELEAKFATPDCLWPAAAPTVRVLVELLTERPELWNSSLPLFVTYCGSVALDTEDANNDPADLEAIRGVIRATAIPLFEQILTSQNITHDAKVEIARVLGGYAPDSQALRTQLPSIVIGWCRAVPQREQQMYQWAATEFFEVARRILRGTSEWVPLLQRVAEHIDCPTDLKVAAREALERA
jgi:hypothetical protein